MRMSKQIEIACNNGGSAGGSASVRVGSAVFLAVVIHAAPVVKTTSTDLWDLRPNSCCDISPEVLHGQYHWDRASNDSREAR